MRLFSSKLVALHLLGVAATTAATLLGLWQLDAWQAGRATQAQDLASARPVPLPTVLAPDAPFPADDVGRPVRFGGRWLPEGTLLVTGREHDGRSGRWVVTPVAVCDPTEDCGGAPAMLVVRGWLPAGDAVPPPPTGRGEVTGWLQPGEGGGLPDPDPRDRELTELRIASAIQHLDRDLYGGFVIAQSETLPRAQDDASSTGDGSTAEALEPVTPASLPEPATSTSLRNLLYALQWWVFAGFAVFLWWRWVRDEIDADRDPGNSSADQETAPLDARITSTP